MSLMSEANTIGLKDLIHVDDTDLDHLIVTGYVAIRYLKPNTVICSRDSFLPACDFCAGFKIFITCSALFPLQISHPNPIKNEIPFPLVAKIAPFFPSF